MYHDESSMKQALCLEIQIMQGNNQLDEFSVIHKQNYLWKTDFPEISVEKNSLPSLEKNPKQTKHSSFLKTCRPVWGFKSIKFYQRWTSIRGD